MRVLIVATEAVLEDLKVKLPRVLDYVELDNNAYTHKTSSALSVLNQPNDGLNICFGAYYADIPEGENRWDGKKGIADVIIEFDTDKMQFLKGETTRYSRIKSDVFSISEISVLIDGDFTPIIPEVEPEPIVFDEPTDDVSSVEVSTTSKKNKDK